MKNNLGASLPNHVRRESALTLLELLVVVAILAVLATVALQTTSDFGEQARYDATVKTLDTFRGAVLGPQGQVGPDGGSTLSGFLSDVGRLPIATSIINPEISSPESVVTQGGLLELYAETLPSGLSPYQIVAVAENNSSIFGGVSGVNTNEAYSSAARGFIRIPAGWRGPYIRKGSSAFTLVDGWGKPLVSPWDLGVNNVAVWPTMLLQFRSDLSAYSYGPSNLYTPVLNVGQQVAGIYARSGFDAAPSSGVYSGQFDSLISRSEIRNDLLVQVTAPTGKYSITNSFPLLLFWYAPNPDFADGQRPILIYGQQVTFSANPTIISLAGLNSPTVGVRGFRASLRINNTTPTNYASANYARSAPMLVPVTRYTQVINIPLP